MDSFSARENDARYTLRKQGLRALGPLLGAQRLQEGMLREADHLDALLREVLEEARQPKARTIDRPFPDLVAESCRAGDSLKLKAVATGIKKVSDSYRYFVVCTTTCHGVLLSTSRP